MLVGGHIDVRGHLGRYGMQVSRSWVIGEGEVGGP